MSKRHKISFTKRAGKFISILLMTFCLSFLTGVNFLVFPDKHVAAVAVEDRQQDENKAPTPVEEKSNSSCNSLSVQEEYLHEKHSFRDFARLDKLIHDRIMEAEKLQIVHYELLVPPPKA